MGKEQDLQKTLEQYVEMQKNLMNEKRIKILIYLNEHDSTWSNLMNEIDIRNPKLLQDHITILSNNNLIKKNTSGMYVLTDKGRSLVTFYMDELFNFSKMKKELED